MEILNKFLPLLILILSVLLLVSTATSEETKQKAFTQVGSHTWEVPSGVEEVKILVVGGGGGGGEDSDGGDGGGGSHDPRPDSFNNHGGLGGGGHGGQEPYSTDTCSGGTGDDGENGIPNTGGGGGGGSTDSGSGGCGGHGGAGIVLIKYNGDFAICDRRGPQEECISNSTHNVDNQHFNISSLFQSESTAEFNSLTGTATINVTNTTRISGLWRGGFEIFSERTIIRPGADFRPEGNRIILGK